MLSLRLHRPHTLHTSHSSDTSHSSELDPADNFPPDVQPVENPFRCIIRGVEADVLYVLGRSKVARSGSDIAFNTGRSKSQVQKVLIRFSQNKIIDRQEFDGCGSQVPGWRILQKNILRCKQREGKQRLKKTLAYQVHCKRLMPLMNELCK